MRGVEKRRFKNQSFRFFCDSGALSSFDTGNSKWSLSIGDDKFIALKQYVLFIECRHFLAFFCDANTKSAYNFICVKSMQGLPHIKHQKISNIYNDIDRTLAY